MSNLPILLTEESWLNSPLSIARYTGQIKLNGIQYVVAGTDLIQLDWLPIYKSLGRDRTIGLIQNGTSLDAAKKMCKLRELKIDLQLKLQL